VTAFARALVVLVPAALLFPSLALAHDDLDAALRHFERAEFARAVRAFDRAEASDHLTREELETLLRGRGLAHHAAGDVGAAEEDLSAWLSLAPSATLDDTTPPAVRRLFERLRGEVAALSVEGSAIPSAAGYVVSARVTGDAFELARGVRIHYEGEHGAETIEGERAEIPLTASTLRYWIEVVGPGGAVIATAGSSSAALEAARAGAVVAVTLPEAPTPLEPPPSSDDTGIIVGVTVGVIVVVAVVAAVLAVVLAPPPDTQLGGPMRVSL
jgi:hypothetical protein